MKLYLLAGKSGCGKDYFATKLKREFEDAGKKVCLLRIAAPLYDMAYRYFGYDPKQKPRAFLQKMGIEVIQEKLGKKFFLIDRLSEDIEVLDQFFDVGIICDGRLPSEFNELKRRYPDLLIYHVIRQNYESTLSPEEQEHITETSVDIYHDYDEVIENKSDEEL